MIPKAALLLLVAGSAQALSRPQDPPGEIAALIDALGDDSLDRRLAAQERLIALGEAALPALEQARTDPDPERACRAETAWLVIRRRIRFATMSADPDLRRKLEGFLDRHPGQVAVVSRVHEYADRLFIPVPGFQAGLFVETLEGGERGRRFQVQSLPSDEAGQLFFAIPPGRYKVISVSHQPAGAPAGVWRWNDVMEREFSAKEAVFLPEMEFVAPMAWTLPEEVGTLSIKADPVLSWKAYPEVVTVRIGVQRVTRVTTHALGVLTLPDGPERRVNLSALLALNKEFPLGVDTVLALSLTGLDAKGRVVSCSPNRSFILGE